MCVFKNHAFIYFLRPPSWSGTVIFVLWVLLSLAYDNTYPYGMYFTQLLYHFTPLWLCVLLQLENFSASMNLLILQICSFYCIAKLYRGKIYVRYNNVIVHICRDMDQFHKSLYYKKKKKFWIAVVQFWKSPIGVPLFVSVRSRFWSPKHCEPSRGGGKPVKFLLTLKCVISVFRKYLWNLTEYPETSVAARVSCPCC